MAIGVIPAADAGWRSVDVAGPPQVMLKSALWQRDVNQQLSALLNAVATHPERAGGSLLLLSLCMACFMRWGRDTAKW